MSSGSSQFGDYSTYYNLLYRDKDYQGEVDYVCGLFSRFGEDIGSTLNLGCGTGRHDKLFSESGLDVCGVDLSEDMLSVARSNYSAEVEFHQGDARTVRLEKQFDSVTALFHVMSYQTTNEDLLAVLETANCHLKPGGLFVFDCWYGPGVLSDPPVTRVKRMSGDTAKVTRLAESEQEPNENLVSVNYEILVEEKATLAPKRMRETHKMRYLFVPEVKLLSRFSGFDFVHYETWMTGEIPKLGTWNVVFVLSKRG